MKNQNDNHSNNHSNNHNQSQVKSQISCFSLFLLNRKNSFSHAFQGISEVYNGELNFKIHLIAAVAVMSTAWFFQVSLTEWGLLILAIAFVLSIEILNTSVEQICDFIHPQKNRKIKSIKDMGAAATLIAAIGSSVIGLLVFLPYLIS